MSHELRTPLNAVIGFSDVMLRELHGPLGNARYQEYAHHICESGGRLLKSSEEALAVTEAMTALMADRSRGRRERLSAATLLRDAWREAGPLSDGHGQAAAGAHHLHDLRHPVRAAPDRAGAGAPVPRGDGSPGGRQHGRGDGPSRRRPAQPGDRGARLDGDRPNASPACEGEVGRNGSDLFPAPHASLRVILARLLLEVQGARLTCKAGEDGVAWTALIEFPGKG